MKLVACETMSRREGAMVEVLLMGNSCQFNGGLNVNDEQVSSNADDVGAIIQHVFCWRRWAVSHHVLPVVRQRLRGGLVELAHLDAPA